MDEFTGIQKVIFDNKVKKGCVEHTVEYVNGKKKQIVLAVKPVKVNHFEENVQLIRGIIIAGIV